MGRMCRLELLLIFFLIINLKKWYKFYIKGHADRAAFDLLAHTKETKIACVDDDGKKEEKFEK